MCLSRFKYVFVDMPCLRVTRAVLMLVLWLCLVTNAFASVALSRSEEEEETK